MVDTRRPALLRLLGGFGAAAGLAIALSSALAPAPEREAALSAEVVARVNGAPIPRTRFESVAARVGAADDGATRAALLDRLVDEELLVQRAVEVGLVASDRSLRKALARAAIDAAVREAGAQPPSESELRAFFGNHAELFAAPGRARVRCIRFAENGADHGAAASAEAAAAAIAAGASLAEAAQRFGAQDGPPVPDALLPEAALRRQLGPALADAALALAPGAVSKPVRTPAGVHLLELVEREPAQVPSFAQLRGEVASELVRRRGDAALRALLAGLRAQTRIVYAPGAARP